MNMLARHENFNRELRNFNSMMDLFLHEIGKDGFFHPSENPGKHLQLKVDEKNVTAFLPCAGCKGSDFEVEVVGDILNVTHKHSSEKNVEEKEKKYISRERFCHEFTESIRLPVPVQGKDSTARYTDGVLTVTMPRCGEEHPRIHCVNVK